MWLVLFVVLVCDVARAQKEILVGAINSMTGSEAMVGKDHRWAYQEAVKDINAAGGVFVRELNRRLPIKLVVVDDKSDPTAAAAAAEKLIKGAQGEFPPGYCYGTFEHSCCDRCRKVQEGIRHEHLLA